MINRKTINDLLRVLPVTSKQLGYPRRQSDMLAYIKKFPSNTVFVYDEMVNRKEELPALFAGFPTAQSFPLFMAKLNNARVWGRNGAVIAENDFFINDVSREFNQGTGFKHSVFYTIRQSKPNFFKKPAAVIGTAGANIYYHWMLDILPRLGLLQKHVPLQVITHFITEYEGLGFQKESLVAANIEEERIVASNDNRRFHLQCEALWVPSLAGELGQPNAFQVNYLRNLFRNWIYQGKPFRKIYISRARTGRRMIQNEAEILPFLKTQGFEIIYCEVMTVAEQVKTFSESAVIVGSHGSAFTNLVFCHPQTKFLEIFNETHIQPCFWFIAQLCSMKYYCLQGKSVAIDENSKSDNTYIEAKQFFNVMARLLTEF